MACKQSAATTISHVQYAFGDNGGRRSLIDRRQFSYAIHIPERRVLPDRRCHSDRRAIAHQTAVQAVSNAATPEGLIPFPTLAARRKR